VSWESKLTVLKYFINPEFVASVTQTVQQRKLTASSAGQEDLARGGQPYSQSQGCGGAPIYPKPCLQARCQGDEWSKASS